jgi:predicted dehydrogenase
MKTRFRLGVLGLGEGRSILSAASKSEAWEIGGICDLNQVLLRERAAEFNVQKATMRFEDLLEDDQIDVIAIYTPDPLHASHIVACLKAGKHVICTKPLFDGMERARDVYDVWKTSGRELFVGQSSRFFEPMLHQRRDFEAGKNGELLSVEAHYNHDHRAYLARTWGRNGQLNWIYQGLSHPLDLIRWYLPDIAEVFGYGAASPTALEFGLKGFDTFHFVLKSTDGKIAQVSGSYGLPQVDTTRDSYVTCILRGEKGSSQADYLELRYATHFEGEGQKLYHFEDKAGYYFRFGGKGYHAGEFQNYIEYFAACLHEGRRAKPDMEEGIRTMATLRAMELSIERGAPVKVKDVLAQYRVLVEGCECAPGCQLPEHPPETRH